MKVDTTLRPGWYCLSSKLWSAHPMPSILEPSCLGKTPLTIAITSLYRIVELFRLGKTLKFIESTH